MCIIIQDQKNVDLKKLIKKKKEKETKKESNIAFLCTRMCLVKGRPFPLNVLLFYEL